MNTIYFNRAVNMKKPSTIRNSEISCPFCDRSQLAEILEEKDDVLLIKNKFSTLKDANMMVIIESNDCDSNMHTYSLEKLESLLTYAVHKWIEFEDTKQYASVALFKNKGLHSSGTIKHPHMQIVGFKEQDCNQSISIEQLSGYPVKIDDFEFNLSTLPRVSFLEYNIELTADFKKLAKAVSLITKYIEANYYGQEASYNFYFYNLGGKRYLKIIPRYPTSAIYIGYDIIQIYNQEQLTEYAVDIEKYYKNIEK